MNATYDATDDAVDVAAVSATILGAIVGLAIFACIASECSTPAPPDPEQIGCAP
jgi:hypothetical protein